jgi:DNA-binding NtrC family response regulator
MQIPFAPTLLVVDDEPDILSTVKAFLEAAIPGATVRACPSAGSALAALALGDVDLVLCDLKMPGMDGLQFLAMARARAEDVPRILMTAYPDTDLAIRAINEGRIQHFLTKPLEPVMLSSVVASLLGDRMARQYRGEALARSLRVMQERAAAEA